MFLPFSPLIDCSTLAVFLSLRLSAFSEALRRHEQRAPAVSGRVELCLGS